MHELIFSQILKITPPLDKNNTNNLKLFYLAVRKIKQIISSPRSFDCHESFFDKTGKDISHKDSQEVCSHLWNFQY